MRNEKWATFRNTKFNFHSVLHHKDVVISFTVLPRLPQSHGWRFFTYFWLYFATVFHLENIAVIFLKKFLDHLKILKSCKIHQNPKVSCVITISNLNNLLKFPNYCFLPPSIFSFHVRCLHKFAIFTIPPTIRVPFCNTIFLFSLFCSRKSN